MAAEDWFDVDGLDDVEPGRHRHIKPRPMPPGMWITAKGEAINFVDMEHAHLMNTIAYVERQYRQLQDTFCDAALDINLLYPAHAGLVAEARRRNLIPKGKRNELVTA